ncbi:pyridoxal-phosphate-dependent aminotransferase family protein [Virgibacillus siamensis]|uniref:pyridoxal-phosphate-dependent aminotransferase family protein n=1 Tax=Virgibacillus siamensis TaxID=480071 RepID=UPI0009846615|nr:alanine--glyoxylate aminotransferase family protein [Virgibacillus siamensis]
MSVEDHLLRIPGPTPIPSSVQQAMSKPMIGHRGTETKALLQRIKPKLKTIFGTGQDVLMVTASGTAGLEAAVVNSTSPGDTVLVLVTGAFGERFAKICENHRLHVIRHDIEWGKAVSPDVIQEYASKNPGIKAVFATFCETSTGVLNPVKELAEAVHSHTDALFIADGVSAVGGTEVKMDEWGIDVLVTGSQKAMMLPPGLTFLAVSELAWRIIEKNRNRPFYLDLVKYRDKLADDSTPFTPGLSLFMGLEQVLNLVEEEGLTKVFNRHHLMKEMTRAAFHAMDIPLLTNESDSSPTVTSVAPADFNPEQLRKQVKSDFGLDLAGGQQHLKGKIFRIGHMGYCSPADVLQTISLLEIGIQKLSKRDVIGKGTMEAQKIYLEWT